MFFFLKNLSRSVILEMNSACDSTKKRQVSQARHYGMIMTTQDGKRPSKITVNLLANGVAVASEEVKPDATGTWAY